MKFRAEQTIVGTTIANYEKLYFDETFNIALCEALRMGRTLEKREEANNVLTRRVRVSPQREIPGPVAKLLGGRSIDYVENVTYTWGSMKGTWVTESTVLADKIESSGTFQFLKHPQGVLRVVEGEVIVKVFGVGGVAERFIVADVERGYASAASFTNRWLEQHPAK